MRRPARVKHFFFLLSKHNYPVSKIHIHLSVRAVSSGVSAARVSLNSISGWRYSFNGSFRPDVMPRSPTSTVESAALGNLRSPRLYVPAVTGLLVRCLGLNSVPSRQMANIIPASLLAKATTIVALPRRIAILVAHPCNACVFGVFHLKSAQAASTSSDLALLLPALLIRPRCCFSPELYSRGTSPR